MAKFSLLDIKNELKKLFGLFNEPPLSPLGAIPTSTPTPTPTPTPQLADDKMIRDIISVYGGQNAPMSQYAPQIAEDTQRYSFLRNNPELVPLIGHLETSSGRNITRPNNILNWGINYPGNNEAFSRMSEEQVLERALSGLGERSPYYQQFRTGIPLTDEELIRFGRTYEPANPSYGLNLVNGRNFIKQQLGY